MQAATAIANPAEQIRPFARLTVCARAYEIAEIAPGKVSFRASGEESWEALDATREDGWHQIASEIMQRSSDALLDFVRMHLIRISGDPDTNGPFEYDLFGFVFAYRDITPAGIELRLPDQDWVALNLPEQEPPLTGRERAIDALLRGYPEIALLFAEDVEAWALRLSAGLRIEPVW
ncbi:hypothetical protein EV663_105111 [Rhodovulum bhavnagarense]|uniref:Uncharacterized protein n=1 Tax=Rhodovulum bhavnagarense TaxID=992286 RepID=A0A4R2REW0_9RHOB|nr:hypothetical protein [Rhodovulum bhavnagarense]TCP61393.1 hypothetical protein EV663_105111 [Rhodovulum bhavnagarense]